MPCLLCKSEAHSVESCPKLKDAQDAVATASVPVTYTNQPNDTGHVLLEPCGKNRYRVVYSTAAGTETIKLWSGTPGIVSSSALELENSLSIRITYGTASVAHAGGLGNYDIIHDGSRRGVARLVETDAQGHTRVYIDLGTKSATIGEGWVRDFRSN